MNYSGVYIHVPFCVRKCNYCDFNSFAADEERIERYIEAISKEIYLYRDKLLGKNIKTVFIGGGTPSILKIEHIEKIIDSLKNNCNFSFVEEFTIEANPGTVDYEKLKRYVDLGINRISFGVQSFNDEILKKIGRIHCSRDAEESIKMARKAGFKNINIDLMYNLPGQLQNDVIESLNKAENLNVDHISLYSLILEEGTKFFELFSKGKLPLMDEDEERETFLKAKEVLKGNGYERYEISNYSRENKKSAHNLIYWNNEEYFGFGLGSHGKLDNVRYSNEEKFDKYLNRLDSGNIPVKEKNQLSLEDNIFESVMLGFRLCEGIEISKINKKYNISFLDYYRDEIERFKMEKMLEIKGNRIFLNENGLDISNYILAYFMK